MELRVRCQIKPFLQVLLHSYQSSGGGREEEEEGQIQPSIHLSGNSGISNWLERQTCGRERAFGLSSQGFECLFHREEKPED